MRLLIVTVTISLLCLITSCGGGGKSNNPTPAIPPSAAILAFPNQDAVCISGDVISASQSTVQFKWNPASNTDSYMLTYKNLLTGSVSTQSTTQTQLGVVLLRNTPYSWFVTSIAKSISTTASSDTWKFYNSGAGVVTYPPFPADNLYPATGQFITVPASGTITLSWMGSDPDNDITNYDIYFGTTPVPPLLKSANIGTTLSNVLVSSATTYYFQIVTRDSNNNTSASDIIQFNTN